MKDKKDILKRVYMVYFFVCLFASAIVIKVVQIQFVQKEMWLSRVTGSVISEKNIDAVRGNIYATDGSLMATSVPIFEVRMDPNTAALTEEVWNNNIDSLSLCLADMFDDKTADQFKQELVNARYEGKRYHLIRRNVKYNQLKKIKTFPIFELGKYKGGFLFLQQNRRERPFRVLAARTIGYDRDGMKPVGLEGAYSDDLKGISGKRLMQKIGGGVWKPVNDDNEIEPEDGCDLYTTLDVNFQDVAERALLAQLKKSQAHHGSVLLMEVKTGAIKAIANLSLAPDGVDGEYYEYYNYAIGESTEPGSTFKLAAVMAALEDGLLDVTDSVDTEDGTCKFFDRTMRDSHIGGYGKITLQQAFEKSSNVGISKLINEVYQHDPQAFVDRLYKMNLNQKTGVEIAGEGQPLIKNTMDKSWSGVTLPWMSIGYEVSLTPLQILTFYNAIANGGKMVKPKFVQEIRKRGKVVQEIETVVISESICSKRTIAKVQGMLEGVVTRGTAQNLENATCRIAGKTGTSQVADKDGYGVKITHQGSFVGYFPAENPTYSCIVVINKPQGAYYGNLVAAPIFKEIANNVYASSIEIHDKVDFLAHQSATRIPVSKNGSQADLLNVLNELEVPLKIQSRDNKWTISMTGVDTVEVMVRKVQKGLVPNVVGMSVKDAIFLLENAGLNVHFTGNGVVKKQSIPAGYRARTGAQISLEMS